MKKDTTITVTKAVHAVGPMAGRVEDEPLHTAGDWTVSQYPEGYSLNVIADDGIVAKVLGTSRTELETRANAKLIAMAPKLLRDNAALLDALKGCSEYFAQLDEMQPFKSHGMVGTLVRNQARAAIVQCESKG